MGRAINVLNTRAPGFNFAMQNKSEMSIEGFNSKVRYAIDHGYPVILSINTQSWPPYNTTYRGGHILLIDGYKFNQEAGELEYQINDVNDCAFGWTAGKYKMLPYQVWGGFNYLIW